jgi:hypothetical protein
MPRMAEDKNTRTDGRSFNAEVVTNPVAGYGVVPGDGAIDQDNPGGRRGGQPFSHVLCGCGACVWSGGGDVDVDVRTRYVGRAGGG